MNIFIQELARRDIDPAPDTTGGKIVVEDNVGESIHVHYRDLRIEMSITDFETFAEEVINAKDVMENGNC